jgi:hypothetical protein
MESALNSAHDARIGSAAADIAVHVRDDLLSRRLLVGGQQRGGLHNLPGLAIAALRHLLGDPNTNDFAPYEQTSSPALSAGDVL